MKKFRNKMSKTEYTIDMMPHTRRAVFFDVLKLQYKSLLLIGVLFLAAAVPLIAAYVFEQVYSSIMLDQVTVGSTEYASVLGRISLLSEIVAFVKIPLYCLFAIVLAGGMRMIRQYAYEECVHFSTDLMSGIKQNTKQTVILMLLASLLWAISYFAYGLRHISDGMMGIITVLPVCLFLVIFLPIAMIMAVLIPIYNNGFLKNFKLAVYIFAKEPFKIILACICCLSIFAVSFIPNFYTGVLGRVLGVVLLPFGMLGFYLFMFNVLDKHINNIYYPEIVGKGTF